MKKDNKIWVYADGHCIVQCNMFYMEKLDDNTWRVVYGIAKDVEECTSYTYNFRPSSIPMGQKLFTSEADAAFHLATLAGTLECEVVDPYTEDY